MTNIFPFPAIVGQERMKRALLLNAVNPRIGGVLIRGERGTAKSTAARALAALLPEERAVGGCRFGCDPDRPTSWCTECKERKASGEVLPVEKRRTAFVDLPVSATEDRVTGTMDIERAIQKGERWFEPGVLAAANRGLLYIDEVNLLDDHVVDILLDSAASGMNIVEREGISFAHPARFILVGTMNPEEGDLRPQLLDRFALCVDVLGIADLRDRVAIMERNLAFEFDPEKFRAAWHAQEVELSEEIERARGLVEHVAYTSRDLLTIAGLTASLNVDGHRADLVILKAARAQAALEGRSSLTDHDIVLAAELALPHRLKHGPMQPGDVNLDNLGEQMEQIQADLAASMETTVSPAPSQDHEGVKKKHPQPIRKPNTP
jgi:Mg-chelatase subunit ChlI